MTNALCISDGVPQNTCSEKHHKIHRKIPAMKLFYWYKRERILLQASFCRNLSGELCLTVTFGTWKLRFNGILLIYVDNLDEEH